MVAGSARLALGEDSADSAFAAAYPLLDKLKDLWMKDLSKTLTLGDGTHPEPWIWRVGL